MELNNIAWACERVWDQIGGAIGVGTIPAEEMIELATDADRLNTYGYTEEHKAFKKLVNEHGLKAFKMVAEAAKYEYYEGADDFVL